MAVLGLMLQIVRWLLAQTSSQLWMPPSTMSEANTSATVPSSNSTCIDGEVVDVVVVAADVAFVAEVRQPGDGVRAGGDGLGADGPAVAGAALHAASDTSAAVSGWQPLPISTPPPQRAA